MIIIKLFKTHTFIGKIGSALHFIKLHCSDSDKVPWLKSYMCVCPYIHICIKGMRVYYIATFFHKLLFTMEISQEDCIYYLSLMRGKNDTRILSKRSY